MAKTSANELRILFFIDNLRAGGKERRFTELLKGLKRLSTIEFEIVLMSSDIHYQDILNLNCKIHYVIRKSKKDLSVFKKFYKICKIYQPDIAQCCDSMTAVYFAPISKLLKIKFVNGMISDAPGKQNILNKSWLRAKITFPFSNIIVGNSQAGIDAYKAPKKKSHVIHNGFDFQRIKNITSSDSIRRELEIDTKFIVGMVASFSDKKDYKTYLTSAQLLLKKRDDIVFLLIGQNTDSPALKNLIPNEIFNHFRFLGRRTGIESFINAMNICVLATFTEGISNSIMEYMALGKPVVATSGGGTNEIVEDQKTGFLVKVSDAEDMSNRIEWLLTNADKRNQMGKLGQERITDLFSIDRMVLNYVSIYTQIAPQKQ